MIKLYFDPFYFLKLCPIFLGLFQNLSDRCQKSKDLGFINDENWFSVECGILNSNLKGLYSMKYVKDMKAIWQSLHHQITATTSPF